MFLNLEVSSDLDFEETWKLYAQIPQNMALILG